jgi:hypothetical protein
MQPFEVIKYKGCTIELHTDEDPESPREWDNVGEMLYTSTRYNLGDRRATSEEIDRIIESSNNIYLPVYAYIHSGTRLNTTGFSCPWDSGQCGIIWCTKAKAVKEWGKKRFTRKVEVQAHEYLRGEIETLDAYFNGAVIGYITKDPDGEEIDSCWGFYPEETKNYSDRYQYAVGEAKSVIDHFVSKRAQQDSEHLALIGA